MSLYANMNHPQPWERLRRIDSAAIDYPGANWVARVHRERFLVPRDQRAIRYVIIHITGGPAQTEGAALNTFATDPELSPDHDRSSAHYVVNRRGVVTQLVRDAHIANHVGGIHSRTNRESIGIEHVNPWQRNLQLHPTDEQYAASARLVAWLCYRYRIPPEHNTVPHAPGIRGHKEEAPDPPGAPPSSHAACPNPAWDWERCIGLVQRVRVENITAMIGPERAEGDEPTVRTPPWRASPRANPSR